MSVVWFVRRVHDLSLLLQRVLAEVDVFAKDLHDSLALRNLTHIVDIVFVSDHGMTDTSHPEWLYLDDILGEGYHLIEHEDGQLYLLVLLLSSNKNSNLH